MSADLAALARRLADAEAARRPIARLTADVPDLSVDDAYEIQRLNAAARLAAGQRLAGHKIGLTARVMQEQFGVHEPDYGHLFESMFRTAGVIDLSGLIDPQIEVEPAFVLGTSLAGPGVTVSDVLAATAWVVPAFEIIDSRITGWDIRLADTVADNGSSALVVLGETRRRPDELALSDMDTVLLLDGEPVERGNTAAILGHPAAGIAWLANAIGAHGVVLEAGHVVLPGTAVRAHRIAGRRDARAEFDGLGAVDITFTGRPEVGPR